MAHRDRLLEVHRASLERWRTAMNLVGPGPVEAHYDDADAALAGLEPTGVWADLGTGAGFPGVVLAARFPDLAIELVDSRRKRCVFLEQALADAEVDDGVRVRCTRVEQLPDGSYDGVTGRAFAAPGALLDHARRLLRGPGAQIVLFLQAGVEPPRAPDVEVLRVNDYEVGGRGRRAVHFRWTGRESP